jgi:hypothetical protein
MGLARWYWSPATSSRDRGQWMTLEEERELLDRVEAAGRPATRLGPDLREPWRVA